MARLCFLGSPEAAAVCLQALHDARHEIVLVVTGGDARRARRAEPTPTAVGARALELGLPISANVGDVTSAGAEIGIVVAFGRLIRREILEQLLMVNVHFSLLPRWRGAAPVERAILAGDDETGVSLMRVEEGLDTGGVYARRSTAIGPEETAAELTSRLSVMGASLLVERLVDGLESLGVAVPQQGETTYAAKITSEDLWLDFARPAADLVRVVRAGKAWTIFRGRRLIVHRAKALAGPSSRTQPGAYGPNGVATADGFFLPEVVQPEGRGRQGFAEWLRGARVTEGELFGPIRSS